MFFLRLFQEDYRRRIGSDKAHTSCEELLHARSQATCNRTLPVSVSLMTLGPGVTIQ